MKWNLTLSAITAVVVLSAAGWIGYHEGRANGQVTRSRAELVWPKLMAMPEADRAVIAGYAETCRLEESAATKTAVVACLRQAALDPHARIPKAHTAESARERLEALLAGVEVN